MKMSDDNEAKNSLKKSKNHASKVKNPLIQQTLTRSINKSDSTATSMVTSVDKSGSAKKVDNRQENSEEDDEIKKQVKFKTNLISPATDSKYIHRTQAKRIHDIGSNRKRNTSEDEEGSEESIIGNSDEQ
jgi:hypothetical protein